MIFRVVYYPGQAVNYEVTVFTALHGMQTRSYDEISVRLSVRLDKFWMNQEIIYDYHAEIQGTGSRSEIAHIQE